MHLTQAHIDLLVCPVCHGGLTLQAETVDCLSCGRRYPIQDGLPILLAARATRGSAPGEQVIQS